MKKTIFFLLSSLAALAAAASCHKEESAPSLRIGISAGEESGSVRVSLVLDAPQKDGYTLTYDFFQYDVLTGARTILLYQTMTASDIEPLEEEDPYSVPDRTDRNVSFPGGRRTYIARGLEEGSYLLSVTLSREDITVKGSALFVVTSSGVIDNGEDPNGNGNSEDPNGNGEDPNGNGNGEDPNGKEKAVTDFTLPGTDASGTFALTYGQTKHITPQYTPADATPDWTVQSSNPGAFTAEADASGITLTPVAPGRGSLTVSSGDVVRTVPVTVSCDVTVSIAFVENTATDAQVQNKIFPCNLRFDATPALAFDSPITFNVSMEAVVTRTNHDAKKVSDRRKVELNGNGIALYNIQENILVPAWDAAGRQADFGLSVSMSIVKDNPLDPALWRITYDEAYKTQTGLRITQYITSGLQ